MTILLSILTGLARGLREGIIMTAPGPREHVAFYMYHILDVAVIVGFAWLAVRLVIDRRSPWTLAALLVILWETFEIGYAVSRGLWGYEHIVVLDIISVTITDWHVWALHSARIAAAGILLWRSNR